MSLLTRDELESDYEKTLISSLAHSTLANALPSVKHPDIHLETTLSTSGPVCLKRKALLIGIQYYNSTNAQLDDEDELDTPADGQLKGPHVDVQNMRQLLLGKAFRRYHSYGFLIPEPLFLCQVVMATTQTISLCLLTMAIQTMCSPRKRTS